MSLTGYDLSDKSSSYLRSQMWTVSNMDSLQRLFSTLLFLLSFVEVHRSLYNLGRISGTNPNLAQLKLMQSPPLHLLWGGEPLSVITALP